MSNRPRISVIIPTLNEASRVVRAVKSALDAKATEVIVVDGGSEDETLTVAEQAGALITQARKGRAAQQNVGFEFATSPDVCLFLHADNWLDSRCLEGIRSIWSCNEPLVGAFRQRIDADGAKYRLLELGNSWRVRCFRQPYGDQGIFVSSDIFREVGGFPDVRLMEEFHLMRRIRRVARPVLLRGPIYVDARRWQQNGVIRQTLRNWSLIARYLCGVSTDQLAVSYPNHCERSR